MEKTMTIYMSGPYSRDEVLKVLNEHLPEAKPVVVYSGEDDPDDGILDRVAKAVGAVAQFEVVKDIQIDVHTALWKGTTGVVLSYEGEFMVLDIGYATTYKVPRNSKHIKILKEYT